jgi:hypothetical protein
MHASSLAILALCAVVLASPTQDTAHPTLERRQLQAIPVVGSVISIGLGAAAVHKNHNNQQVYEAVSAEVHQLQSDVENLKVMEQTAMRLQRRQIGTITSSVAIHRSKKLRKGMDGLDQEIDALEHDVAALMDAEGLHDEAAEHEEEGGEGRHLERRQLGLILGPVATHKNKKDKKRLLAMQDRVTHIHQNVDRCRAAIQSRLARTRRAPRSSFNGGVMSAGSERGGRPSSSYGNNGRVVQVRVTTSHDHYHD